LAEASLEKLFSLATQEPIFRRQIIYPENPENDRENEIHRQSGEETGRDSEVMHEKRTKTPTTFITVTWLNTQI
jgi:hypothetical protein